MFHTSQGNTQVYSLFGSYIIEQHGGGCLPRYIDDIPRPDLELGKKHPLSRKNADSSRHA